MNDEYVQETTERYATTKRFTHRERADLWYHDNNIDRQLKEEEREREMTALHARRMWEEKAREAQAWHEQTRSIKRERMQSEVPSPRKRIQSQAPSAYPVASWLKDEDMTGAEIKPEVESSFRTVDSIGELALIAG